MPDPDSEARPEAQHDVPPARRRRRASLPAAPGSDPEPHDPPREPRSEGENDDRLRADIPPHY